MKKVLFIIGLFFINLVNIYAVNYSNWSTEYPTNIDKRAMEEERRYKWYKEEIVNKEYLEKDKCTHSYTDIDDFIFSEERKGFTVEENSEILKSELIECTYNRDEVDRIIIKNTMESNSFRISEIQIKDRRNNNALIDYEIISNNEYKSLLKDGMREEYFELKQNEEITFILDKKYDPSDIEFAYWYINTDHIDYAFNFNYASKDNVVLFYKERPLEKCIEECLAKIFYSNTYYNYLTQNRLQYTYKTKLFSNYDIEKVYYEGYSPFVEGYTKDESSEIIYYRYITDKCILKDDGKIVSNSHCEKNECDVVCFNNGEVSNNDDIEQKGEEKEEEPLINDIKDEVIDPVIENPQTLDFIEATILEIIISSFILSFVIIVIVIKYNNKKNKNHVMSKLLKNTE